MTSLELLLWSVALYTAGGFISLLFKRQEKMAVYVAGITAMAGGILGLFSAVPVLMSGETLTFFAQGPFPFAHFVVRLDSLAAFMVMVISLLVTVSALYSLNYVQEYLGRGAWSMGFFLNLFIASMVALVVMDNAFWFIILFEMMSLASWFLVIADQDDKSIRAGLLYFFIAHAGSVLIMIAFFLMWRESGSLDFDSFRQLSLSPAMASVVFLLGFFGFGAKAGMLPLHSWLPQAHPAAPSHARHISTDVRCDGENRYFRDHQSRYRSAGRNPGLVGYRGTGLRRGLFRSRRYVCTGGARYQTSAGVAYRGKHRDYPDGGRCGNGRYGE